MAQTCGHALPGRLKFLQNLQGSVDGMTTYKKDQSGMLVDHHKTLKHRTETGRRNKKRIFRLFQTFLTCEGTRSEQDLCFLRFFLVTPCLTGFAVV